MYGPVMAAIRMSEKQGISDFQKAIDKRAVTVINIEENVTRPSDEYLRDVAAVCGISLIDVKRLCAYDNVNVTCGFSELKRYQLILLKILRLKLEQIPIFSEEEAKRYCRR